MVSSGSLGAGGPYGANSELRMAGHPRHFYMMFYTYIIESLNCSGKYYIGHTSDLKQRVSEHNAGRCVYTAKFVPWKLKIYVAFETLEQTQHFERYLKSDSGHAFAGRHFCPIRQHVVKAKTAAPKQSGGAVSFSYKAD
jgi:predicted GIY-YIG superfamily endonuclease